MATCAHIHISSNLWCLYCCELSFLLFDCDHLHVDEIIFVLQLVEWIVYFIKSVCGMYELIFVYLLSFSFFHICLYVIFLCSIFHFSHFFEYFLRKFWVSDLDDLYTDISFIIVSYFVYTYYYTHVLLFHEIFSVFQLTLFAVIIMSICTHSHGSAKQWWHSSWSMVWYMLTSTKTSFVKTL